jgi:predicted RNase H-like HicB family nuclease
MVKQYPALIFKDEGTEYAVVFPDFDGCVTSGASPEEAHLMAEEALQLHIDSMVEDGEEIPEPRPLAEAYARAREEDAMVVITVPARLPGYARAKRINVTLDEELLADIDHLAAKRSMSRSALLAAGARRLLQED